jgi:hypothetical protein
MKEGFEAGKREIGLWLIGEMTEIHPEHYPRLMMDGAVELSAARRALAKGDEYDV